MASHMRVFNNISTDAFNLQVVVSDHEKIYNYFEQILSYDCNSKVVDIVVIVFILISFTYSSITNSYFCASALVDSHQC